MDSDQRVLEHAFTYFTWVFSFVLGYSINKIELYFTKKGPDNSGSSLKSAAQELRQQALKKVEIDDTKFVTNVSTDSLKSVGTVELGVVTRTNDNVSAAAAKLAYLKNLKG